MSEKLGLKLGGRHRLIFLTRFLGNLSLLSSAVCINKTKSLGFLAGSLDGVCDLISGSWVGHRDHVLKNK